MFKQQDTAPKMLLCHFSDGELEGLDALQGGPDIDPETGLRQYPKLAQIIMIPEIQDIFRHVWGEMKENKGKVSPHLRKIYKETEKETLPFKPVPEDKEAPAKQLEELGRFGDTRVAWVPEDMVLFLGSVVGTLHTNPKTGLFEFGLGKILRSIIKPISNVIGAVTGGRGDEVLRIAGTIGGALLGGPMGAGLGNTLASYGTGKSLGQSAWSGIKNYGLATGIQGAGQYMGLGASTPGTAGFFGGSNPLMSAYYGAQTGGASGALSGLTGGNAAIPSAAGTTGTAAAAKGAAAAAPGGIGGILGSLASSPLAMMAAMSGLQMMGAKEHYKKKNEQARTQNEDVEKTKREMGYYLPWEPVKEHEIKHYERNPKYTPDNEEKFYRERTHHKKGGQVLATAGMKSGGIKGPGNGQDDAIKTVLKPGTEIIDASTVADLGDGSSESGFKVLDEMVTHIRKKHPKPIIHHVTKIIKKQKNAPVYVANDEYAIDPITVALAGKGDLSKGDKVFRNMVKEVRKHKASNGLGLPPKAKHPLDYLKMRA
jgi:hypothetical protein